MILIKSEKTQYIQIYSIQILRLPNIAIYLSLNSPSILEIFNPTGKTPPYPAFFNDNVFVNSISFFLFPFWNYTRLAGQLLYQRLKFVTSTLPKIINKKAIMKKFRLILLLLISSSIIQAQNNKLNKLLLIGDEFGDRGMNDYYTFVYFILRFLSFLLWCNFIYLW